MSPLRYKFANRLLQGILSPNENLEEFTNQVVGKQFLRDGASRRSAYCQHESGSPSPVGLFIQFRRLCFMSPLTEHRL